MEAYRNTLDMEDDEERQMAELQDGAMEIIEQRWRWQWLCGHLQRTVTVETTGEGTLDPVKEVERLNEQDLPRPRVDRPFASRQLVFLHLFSGQRRRGDLQEAVETFAAKHGLQARALSVDVVISLRYGDILRHDTQQILMEALRPQAHPAKHGAGHASTSWLLTVVHDRYVRSQRRRD